MTTTITLPDKTTSPNDLIFHKDTDSAVQMIHCLWLCTTVLSGSHNAGATWSELLVERH